jgi:hypothetical protein
MQVHVLSVLRRTDSLYKELVRDVTSTTLAEV